MLNDFTDKGEIKINDGLYKLATWLREARPHLQSESEPDRGFSQGNTLKEKSNIYPFMVDRK